MRQYISAKNFILASKQLGATVLGGLWALEWAWHSAEISFGRFVGVRVGVALC